MDTTSGNGIRRHHSTPPDMPKFRLLAGGSGADLVRCPGRRSITRGIRASMTSGFAVWRVLPERATPPCRADPTSVCILCEPVLGHERTQNNRHALRTTHAAPVSALVRWVRRHPSLTAVRLAGSPLRRRACSCPERPESTLAPSQHRHATPSAPSPQTQVSPTAPNDPHLSG
jgi:hypothetical protein